MSAGPGNERATAAPPTAPAIVRAGPLTLVAAGRTAFREVPGLRTLLIKGILLFYGVFVLLGLIGWGLLYRFAIGPLSAWMTSGTAAPSLWSAVGTFVANLVVWMAQVVLLGSTLILAFVLALALMGFWFESLAGRIVAHARGTAPEAPFGLPAWAASLAQALRDSVLLVALAVLALLLGFVPLVGPFLAFTLSCYVMGREVREPYLAVRAGQGAALRDLRRGLVGWTFWVGALPAALALVPWLGWMLLPVVLTWQVAGVAWLSETGAGPRR